MGGGYVNLSLLLSLDKEAGSLKFHWLLFYDIRRKKESYFEANAENNSHPWDQYDP